MDHKSATSRSLETKVCLAHLHFGVMTHFQAHFMSPGDPEVAGLCSLEISHFLRKKTFIM